MEGLNILLKEVENAVTDKLNNKVEETLTEVRKQVEDYKKYTPTVVVKDGKEVAKISGLKHKRLNDLIKLVGADQNVILVGMAGTGKTKSAEQVAEALKLNFYCMSVGAQTSKADILGYMDANGKYVSTAFRKAYEEGGVYVMDEIDAGNSNVLIVLNSALSNGICSFPDGMIRKNDNFRFIATANTYGNGADRTYVGRNQLDGATLDRFIVLDWNVDEDLERGLVEGYKFGMAWQDAVKKLRADIAQSGIRAIVSPRMSIKGATCLELGMTADDTIEMVVLPQIPADKRNEIKRKMNNYFTESKKEFPPRLFKKATVKKTEGQPKFELEF